MSASDASNDRLALLHRLTPTELEVLRRRCGGMTTAEVAGVLGTTQQTAGYLIGNIYDKLGITYAEGGGTSLARLMEYCPLLADPSISQISAPPAPATESPPLEPSGRALALVTQDDQALLSQRQTAPAEDGSKSNRRLMMILGGVLILILGGLVFLLVSDDDDKSSGQAAQASPTAAPTLTSVPAVNAPEPTKPPATVEPTATREPTPTAVPSPTPVPPTETPKPTATSAPTATPQPTATSAPTATPPTSTAKPLPQPGEVIYEADWSAGPGDWVVPAGWSAQPGMLASDGVNAGSILAPYRSDQSRYAVEADIAFAGAEKCDALVGVLAGDKLGNDDSTVNSGYVGAACPNEWRILAVREAGVGQDELSSGEATLGDERHTYRLEVEDGRIRLFIDLDFAGEATDSRWPVLGSPGIFLDGSLQVMVTGFRVYALTAA